MTLDPGAPSAWVIRFAALLPEHARVLDVAAGNGRHTRYLMRLGHHVTAIDRDQAALDVSGASNIVCADLETSQPLVSGARFDGVVVTHYLHRPLYAALEQWVGDQGILIYETFAVGQEQLGRPKNPDFLLQPGELLSAFGALQVVAFEQGVDHGPPARVVQRLCAVRRNRAQRLSGFTDL